MKQKNLKLAVMALCSASLAQAQNPTDSIGQRSSILNESAFTFTEAQLGEDDDMSQNVTIVNSNNNIYASEVGYLFSPVRFRYRAFDQKYNDVYINGIPMNDMETGQFRFSNIGGLNQQTKNQEFALPFESNKFAMTGMAGSNNYNFRPASMPAGHRITLTGANRNYTLRGMYTFNTGLSDKGWAFSGNITYRWANEGYVEGTFYNSLSYFLGVQKVFGNGAHSLAFSTWGNPTERASQGAGTDEMYWMANDRYYNPYWGYQNGKKRNSRIVNDFAPTALLTWDWKISDNDKLTTSLMGKYSMYKSTKLNYNNADNPHPNYWKNMPSSYYDIWDESNSSYRTSEALQNWHDAYDYWSGPKANRQIDWDRLYYSNKQASAQGQDAMYYIQAKHNDALTIALASTFNKQLDKDKNWNIGIVGATNKGMHYQTMEDLLGATQFHNINTYALGTYPANADEIQYDLNNPNAVVKEDDKFGYNYNLLVNNGKLWTSYSENFGILHYLVAAKLGYTAMQRDGKMRNGLAKDNSYGKSHTAQFIDGGLKFGANINLGRGNTFTLGLGYEHKAPQAKVAFVSPEINNDFVKNLKNERVFSSEIGYQLQTSWLHANINAYYSYLTNVSDWQNFYYDDINSFSYVSITGMKKAYYGVEAGLKFKVTSAFDVKLIGQISDAKILNDNTVSYMNSTKGVEYTETIYNKNMRDNGTPLTAASLGLSYHSGGWFLDLNANYYDRIYLSYSPCYRYHSSATARGNCFDNNEPIRSAFEQAKGHGGFMLDGSIGRSIYLKRGSLSINLSVTNILNNTNIVTGGYEQSRSDYSKKTDGTTTNRAYKFSKNPMKFFAYGTNGMLNIAYKF
ncbi:TonB-dependent receptor [Prevotella sp.]|uniref:TonB-dependent receptor n=1 Tax=uncultured Prevotella sp. TaxID=159272 RepID=UPI0026366586|nr:TonB-dependent receptor [uncultured Prevotella sp.]